MNESDQDTDESTRRESELQEGVDYYLEDGLFVFTAEFLLRRGYCCESGCRHCPYQSRSPRDSFPGSGITLPLRLGLSQLVQLFLSEMKNCPLAHRNRPKLSVKAIAASFQFSTDHSIRPQPCSLARRARKVNKSLPRPRLRAAGRTNMSSM